MKGALVFLAAFLLFIFVTMAYPSLPPATQIYNALNLPAEIPYSVAGVIGATLLILSVFNGVVYGVIIWLIYSLAAKAMKREPKKGTEPQQTQRTQK
jgi:hypothetical protein